MPNYIKVVLAETKEFGHFVLQREGIVTKRKSFPVSDRKPKSFCWHGTRGSNSRHLVLETSALPTELVPYCECKGTDYFEYSKFLRRKIQKKFLL